MTGQWDDYTAGCSLGYLYFKENYKSVAIDLIKEQALNAGSKAIQQISFTKNLEKARNETLFIVEEAKETALDFSQGTAKVL